jgi:signal peptidase II
MITFKALPKKGSIVIGLLVFVLDQLSKFWVLEHVGPGESMHVFPCLNFMLVYNPGVTFGLLRAYSNVHYILLVAGVCVLSCIVTVWWWRAENALQRYATAIILFGAFGNLATTGTVVEQPIINTNTTRNIAKIKKSYLVCE